MKNRNLILLSLIIGLFMAMVGSIYDLNLKVFAQKPAKDDYTIDILDRELKHVNDKFESINRQLQGIRKDILNISDDQTNMRVKMAESAGVYGGGASVFIYLLGKLGEGLWNRKKKNGK